MRDILKVGFKLFAIAAIAGLVLGLTNAVTEGPIEQQSIAAAQAARQQVLSEAASFELLSEADGTMDSIYEGYSSSGAVVGYTGTITTRGYGGLIEVTVGVTVDGTITGVSVGGSDFSETAGLGAHVKDEWFGAQFKGMSSPLDLQKNGGQVEAVTSATISSTAVTKAVDTACKALVACAQGR